MSDDNNIFEKYVTEKKSLSQRLKEPKSWVIIVTVLATIIVIIAAYKSIILDKMSPEEIKKSITVLELDSKWVETSEELQIKADHGYKASSKAAFINNRENWKRVTVKVFAKSSDSDYALLGSPGKP